MRAAFNSDDELKVQDAVRLVEICGDRRFEEDVIDLLKHEDGLVRIDAIEVLENLGSEKAFPRIMELQNDQDYLVRAYAFSSVGFFGDNSHVQLLVDALTRETEARVQAAILVSLIELTAGLGYLEQLFAYLEHEDHRIRCFTVNSLVHLSCDEWRELISRRINDLKALETTRAVKCVINSALAEL